MHPALKVCSVSLHKIQSGVNNSQFVKSRSYLVQSYFGSKDDKHSGRSNIARNLFSKNNQNEPNSVSNNNSLELVGSGGKDEKVKFQKNKKFVVSKNGMERRRFRSNESSSSDDELDSDLKDKAEGIGGWRDVKKSGSSASLGKYDIKIIKRRVPHKELEKDIDFSEQVELLRKELAKKKLAQMEEKMGEGETIYSKKKI